MSLELPSIASQYYLLVCQNPLGLIFKNENKNEEMIDILQELHDKYVPIHIYTEDNTEHKEILKKVFFGGGSVTEERSRNAIYARSDGDDSYEKLEGLIPKVEDWHCIRILYQVCINKCN